MARQSMVPEKKKRGPPATGKGTQVQVRLQPHQLKRLDAWIAMQPTPCPSRPEAIRALIDAGIDATLPRNPL